MRDIEMREVVDEFARCWQEVTKVGIDPYGVTIVDDATDDGYGRRARTWKLPLWAAVFEKPLMNSAGISAQ